MSTGKHKTNPLRLSAAGLAVSVALGAAFPPKRMADGKQSMPHNLDGQQRAVLLLRK